MSLTDEQFQELIARVVEAGATAGARAAAVNQPPAAQNGGANAAALVGQIPQCNLGKNKLKRFKKWKDWLSDAENKMSFLSITDVQNRSASLEAVLGRISQNFGIKKP